MQTAIIEPIRSTPEGEQADAILRACVHCGFCLATCPTYRLLGNELDSPRGRIYLMKQVLEGEPVTGATQLHLDRCLTCRSCETTCPSGVRYSELLDIGRKLVDQQVTRPLAERLMRRALRAVLPKRELFGSLLHLAQHLRRAAPSSLQALIPERSTSGTIPPARHERTMLVLEGCVQPALAPRINGATARVFDRVGISLVSAQNAVCCGALSFHLDAQVEAKGYMRRNIDAWWPYVEGGVEAIVMTASGCGVMVKDYGRLLCDDPKYAYKAARISALTKDTCEVLQTHELEALDADENRKIAFHAPCTLQHGQQIQGIVEEILTRAGFVLTPVPNGHLCCGSAGTYSLLQPNLSRRLLEQKIDALETGEPDLIATANIGCLLHLQSGSTHPVRHWIELLDPEG